MTLPGGNRLCWKRSSAAKTSDERDQLYFKLALLALGKDDLKARNYAGKIEESGFRKQAEAWVDWGLALSAIEKKKTDLALELNRTAEFTHVQRVWILTQAAKLLAKTDRTKASSLLDSATAEARRIDGGDLDRPRALLAIANALRIVEPARVSEAIFEAVKAANSTDGFTGEGGVITQTMNSRGMIRITHRRFPSSISKEFSAARQVKRLRACRRISARFSRRSAACKRHHRHRPLRAQPRNPPVFLCPNVFEWANSVEPSRITLAPETRSRCLR